MHFLMICVARLLITSFFLFKISYFHYMVSSQPANIGPQDVPRTSPSNVPSALKILFDGPGDVPIWRSWGRPDLTSWGRPNLTSRGRLEMTSRGRSNLTFKGRPWGGWFGTSPRRPLEDLQSTHIWTFRKKKLFF